EGLRVEAAARVPVQYRAVPPPPQPLRAGGLLLPSLPRPAAAGEEPPARGVADRGDGDAVARAATRHARVARRGRAPRRGGGRGRPAGGGGGGAAGARGRGYAGGPAPAERAGRCGPGSAGGAAADAGLPSLVPVDERGDGGRRRGARLRARLRAAQRAAWYA